MALPQRIDPIRTGGLRGGLLSAARPLPGAVNWRQGITFNPDCGEGGTATCVDPGAAPDKTINSVIEPVEFSPFLLYYGAECSTWMRTEELLDLARRGLVRTESKQFAQELQSDPSGTGNPTLNSTATDISGGVSAPLVNTLCGLMDAICENNISELIFHAPVRALPAFLTQNLIEWDEAASLWKMGPHTVVFDCYGTTGPGAVVAADTEAWIYVTGPVEVETGQEQELDGILTQTNEHLELVEKLAILRFDTCAVQAALAQVC